MGLLVTDIGNMTESIKNFVGQLKFPILSRNLRKMLKMAKKLGQLLGPFKVKVKMGTHIRTFLITREKHIKGTQKLQMGLIICFQLLDQNWPIILT